MAGLLQIPAAPDRRRPARHQHDRLRAPRRRGDDVFRVGYFARIAPEKGLHVLADGLRALPRSHRGRARCGSKPPAIWRRPQTAVSGRGHAGVSSGPGSADEFTYHGAVDRDGKLAFLRTLDVLSVPAPYDEPKGVFLLEAMARGVPVVQPRRGAFTEIVEQTGGGLLVTPDDEEALAEGLYQLWQRPRPARTRWPSADSTASDEHYTIARSTDRLLAAYDGAIARASSRRDPDARPLAASH